MPPPHDGPIAGHCDLIGRLWSWCEFGYNVGEMIETDSFLSALEPDAPARALAKVPVLLPVALDQTYDYLLGDAKGLEPGAFVLVPFGPQVRLGVVWDRSVGPERKVDPKKLKTITEALDVPRLLEPSMRFAEWVAKYTLSELGMVLRMMMGAQAAF